MNLFALIIISGMISFAAYGVIAITGRHTREEERRDTARNRSLFIRSFPLLWFFTILTFSITAISLFFIIAKNNPASGSKLFEKEFVLREVIFPLIIMTGIFLPISLKNYKEASLELKNRFPFLIITVLLLVFFNSLTLSLIISLLLKR